MRYSQRRKKKYIIIGLLSIVCIMAIGYAAFSTVLTINSTSEITSSWDVEIMSVRAVNDSSLTYNDAYDKVAPAISNDKQSVTIQTGLLSPGDTRIYEIEVTNKGNLDSEVTTVFNNVINDSTLFSYDGVSPVGSDGTDILSSGGSYDTSSLVKEEPFILTAFTNNKRYLYLTIKFKDSVTSQPKDLNPSVTLSINASQKSDNTPTVPVGTETVLVGGVEVPVVTSGDGLYSDSTEKGRYVYRGANPDNYICLESGTSTCSKENLYRIIAIESDSTLKVIRNTSINGSIPWDLGYANGLSGITEVNSLEGTRYSNNSSDFCYASTESEYYGCKSWGSRTSTYNSTGTTKVTERPFILTGNGYGPERQLPNYDSYINVYLNGGVYPTMSGTTNITGWLSNQNSLIQNNIARNHKFNIGIISYLSSHSLIDNILQEKQYIWKGNVGLINVTDYIKAHANSSCNNNNLYNYKNSEDCYGTVSQNNYLYRQTGLWVSINGTMEGVNYVYDFSVNGQIYTYFSSRTYTIYPTFFLKSTVSLMGKGTNDSNVYRIY